jgi:hypothetical protein
MRIKLGKEVVILLYYYSWEAERSVDAAFGPNWEEFQEYYTEAKRASLQALLNHLLNLLGEHVAECRWTEEEVLEAFPWRRFLPWFLAQFLAERKKNWSFRRREISFIATTFQSMLDLLTLDTRPEPERLRNLRLHMYVCELIVGNRCRGLPQLTRPPRRYHFMQAKHITPEVVDPDPELKQSA